MAKLQKVLSSLLTLSTAFTLSGVGMVATAHGAQLTNASVSLADPTPSANTTHTYTFKVATTGAIGQIQLQYATTASGGTVPENGSGAFSTSAASLNSISNPSSNTADWTLDKSTQGLLKLNHTANGSTSYAAATTFTIVVDGVANNAEASNCDPLAYSDSCWVQMRTYSDSGVTLVDSTAATYTIVDPVTVSATVDPILTFTVAGVSSTSLQDSSNIGTGTTVTTTETTIPFGNITVGTPKIAQQKLNTQTNANNGYFVYGKFVTTGDVVLKGDANSSNNIDKFTNSPLTAATWAAPQAFVAPTGTSASVDSAWLGVRSSDSDLSQFGSANYYAPPDVLGDTGSGRSVMQSTGPDNGGSGNSVWVTFKVQANAFQPADRYTGTWRYNVVPSY